MNELPKWLEDALDVGVYPASGPGDRVRTPYEDGYNDAVFEITEKVERAYLSRQHSCDVHCVPGEHCTGGDSEHTADEFLQSDPRGYIPRPVFSDREERPKSVRTITLHTCWDNHEGPDGTHVDGSPCLDKPVVYSTGETEPCPTCMQPVYVPQRGDHDYGIPLRAGAAIEAFDAVGKVLEPFDINGLDEPWDRLRAAQVRLMGRIEQLEAALDVLAAIDDRLREALEIISSNKS